MLPTHGAATAVFLLSNASRHRNHQNLKTWTDTARSRSSFLAGAVDLEGCAEWIVRLGLVKISETVQLDQALSPLSIRADRPTLVAISSLLLNLDPPPWISLAVSGRLVFREHIPSDDLRDLEWLEPYLDQLLVEAATDLDRRNLEPLREALGRAGELVVLAAARESGSVAHHVADVSNAYGYDVEIHTPTMQRLEIKSTTSANNGVFHLSRNEFDKCIYYGSEWRLVQVTFDSSVFTDVTISAFHILKLRELDGRDLGRLVPPDSATFRWTESAVIRPPSDSWVLSELRVPANLRLPSVRELSVGFGTRY